MKSDWSHLEKYRMQAPGRESRVGDHFGCFLRPLENKAWKLAIIACEASPESFGWEHVSVHGERKHNGKWKEYTPDWYEMSFVKDMFWEEDELVLQFHPPKKVHINLHPHVLHLWRHAESQKALALPPSMLV